MQSYEIERRRLLDNAYKRKKNLTRKRLERAHHLLWLALKAQNLTDIANSDVVAAKLLLFDALEKQTPYMEI